MKVKNGKVLVAGDIMLDIYSFGMASRISPEAPVPVLKEKTNKIKYVPGGATNAAMNLLASGIDEISIFAMVGKDEYGNCLIQLLKDAGIDIRYLYYSDDRPTTVKHRYIAQNNQQILRVDHEDSTPVDTKMLIDIFRSLDENLQQYDLILVSDYDKGFLTEEVLQTLIGMAKKHKIPVLADVKGNHADKYKGATLLKPNRDEVQTLTGINAYSIEDVIEASKMLCRKADCRYVLTTLGADGMILTDGKELLTRVESVAQEVYDVTGAGDTAIAYLAAELVRGSNIYEAVNMANYAAGVQVSKVGTGIVSPTEVKKMMHGWKSANVVEKEQFFYQNDGLKAIRDLKKAGKKIVFTNGCFDILHAGHVDYLRKAKALGDYLVVGVNSDASVKRLKGDSRPVNSLTDRIMLLSALEFVDYVVAFEEDTPEKLIHTVEPDVLVKGGDYKPEDIVGAEFVKESGGYVMTIPLVEGKSTTGIIEKIKV